MMTKYNDLVMSAVQKNFNCPACDIYGHPCSIHTPDHEIDSFRPLNPPPVAEQPQLDISKVPCSIRDKHIHACRFPDVASHTCPAFDEEAKTDQSCEVFYRRLGSPRWFYSGSYANPARASEMMVFLTNPGQPDTTCVNDGSNRPITEVKVVVEVMSWSREG